MPPIFMRDIQRTLLSSTSVGPLLYSYGIITLYDTTFQSISDSADGTQEGQPHISRTFLFEIRFVLYPFRSPLIRVSHSISFPAGTKMLQFPAFPAT